MGLVLTYIQHMSGVTVLVTFVASGAVVCGLLTLMRARTYVVTDVFGGEVEVVLEKSVPPEERERLLKLVANRPLSSGDIDYPRTFSSYRQWRSIRAKKFIS